MKILYNSISYRLIRLLFCFFNSISNRDAAISVPVFDITADPVKNDLGLIKEVRQSADC